MKDTEYGCKIKQFRDYLFILQCSIEDSEISEKCIDQSIRLRQRISALLDIYNQVLDGREFDEDYLERYL